MLGIARKPRGLFGQPSYATPGIGDGVNQRMGDPGDAAPSPQRKGGVFGSGVPWADALYALGGAIGGDGGAAVQQIKQARLAPLIAAQEREAEFANWQRKEQWKRDNPQPVNNDTERDYQFIAQTIGEEAANQYLRNLGDPTVSMTLPGNRVYSGPRSGLGQALGQGSANIDAEPTSEDGFDYTPGPGGRANPSNWKKSGGSTPQASGPFRR